MIKAIETEYAGCIFRSRLEARWAVFFDALGVEWEHEPEGFETSAGRYLPDFRLRNRGAWYSTLWFEVKPPGYPHDRRHAALALETADPLIVAEGMPRDYADQYLGGPLVVHWGLKELGGPEPISLYSDGPGRIHNHLRNGPGSCPRIDRAYRAARSARFGT